MRLPLRADRTLLHEEGACLPLRSRHGQCRACAAACPVQALDVTVAQVNLSDACTGCGQCTAACPTEALTLPEMANLNGVSDAEPDHQPQPLVMECRKVPDALRAQGSKQVPCMGAVRASHLAALSAKGHKVQLMDRGWCQTCDMGSRADPQRHPVQTALELAGLLLQAVDSSARLPVLVREELPLTQCPSALPPAIQPEEKLGRRSFFRQALERPAGRAGSTTPTPMGGDGKAAYPADRRQPSPDRERLLTAMGVLAARSGHDLPTELYPQMQVNDSCCDQRLCVALCPTAALTVRDEGTQSHLLFSSDRCIDCGTCVRACPTGAIQMQSVGGQPGVHTVFSVVRRPCLACGDIYTPNSNQLESEAPSLCPSCTKSQRFMDDAREQLFGGLN